MKNNTRYPYFLVVDDNVDDHLLVVSALTEVFAKPKILSVFESQHALDYIEDSRRTNLIPDLIILDLKHSTLTNAQYFSRLRNDTWLKNTPIIVLVESDEVNIADLKAIGANDIFVKSRSAAQLAEVFKTVAGKWLGSFKIKPATTKRV